MNLAQDLFTLLPLQALAATLALLILVNWQGGNAGGRWAQAGMALLAVGLALRGNGQAALGLAGISAGLSALWWALGLWFTPRGGRWLMAAAPLLLGAGEALLGAKGAPLADLGLAAQLGMLALSLTRPGRLSVLHGLDSRRWRLLALAATLPLLAALPGRAAGIAGDLAVALAAQLALLLALPLLLLAWRGQTEAELAQLAQTDGVTGLTDRLAFGKRSVDLISMARRYDEPLALMVLELDGIEALRAEHGSDLGDRAMALFGSCVQSQMRLGDLAARLSDPQVGVLMARCLPEGPEALDARLRSALAQRSQAELDLPLSHSAGWARLSPGDRDVADLRRRAETALYEARKAGSGRLMAEPGVSD